MTLWFMLDNHTFAHVVSEAHLALLFARNPSGYCTLRNNSDHMEASLQGPATRSQIHDFWSECEERRDWACR